MPDLFANIRRCEYCNATLSGRSDKRFCSLRCKNSWHNAKQREIIKVFRPNDNQMHKNRMILHEHFPESQGKEFISLIKLYQQGFTLRKSTGNVKVVETGEGLTVVYDYGYIIKNNFEIKIYHIDGDFHHI